MQLPTTPSRGSENRAPHVGVNIFMTNNSPDNKGPINNREAPDMGQITLRTRTNLAVPHLISACLFSKQVMALERENQGKEFGAFWEDILANASANVLLTVAALESYVNELFADHETNFPGIRTDVLIKLWESYELKPILDKYDLALLLRQTSLLNRGNAPTQDVNLLIRLRNALTHFKPEWFDVQQDHAKLSSQLIGRFLPSSFFSASESVFPRRWATHGCTAWAIKSAINFIETFEVQSGLPKRLEQFKPRFIYE